jgi:hypothetical protein
MPDNFRYIYSEKSPAQCWDIAARETNSDFIIVAADDVRYSRNFLNRIYYYTTIFDMDKTLMAFRYRYQWGPNYNGLAIDEGGFFKFGEPGFSVLGASGIFRKDLWIKLGGFDSRFYGSFADIDITFRHFYELGMNFFIPPDCFIIEILREAKWWFVVFIVTRWFFFSKIYSSTTNSISRVVNSFFTIISLISITFILYLNIVRLS